LIENLLRIDVQMFIHKNIESTVEKLSFQKNPFPEIAFSDILNQIQCKQKSKQKLPTFFDAKNIIYPSKISVEQTSSEATAKHKSSLIDGEKIIDLTGGFGVDCLFFSKKFKTVFHCEQNQELSEIANHNFKQLEVHNIITKNGDSQLLLQELNQKFDWIYVDPSRRNDSKGKVFLLQDCIPNVINLLDFYFLYSNKIIIKTAPILDISIGISALKFVKEIHVVGVENEVKELLWIIDNSYKGDIEIITSNINKEKTESFSFDFFSKHSISIFSEPKRYLYEPNACIMKSGGFDEVSHQLKIEKLHQNSHLYTSNEIINFPGRTFEIIEKFDYSKKGNDKYLKNRQLNLSIRNFPDTVENIKKKWKIKDGGNDYCFLTTGKNDDKIVLICRKIKS
jgi:protein-L-isoaspartate O-methyltransferase